MTPAKKGELPFLVREELKWLRKIHCLNRVICLIRVI